MTVYLDRKAMSGQPGQDRGDRTGQLGQDRLEVTARKDNKDRKIKKR
jgi:hypothetical protein